MIQPTKFRALRDLWEGCIPFEEAILMLGVEDEFEAEEYERQYDAWDRSWEALLSFAAGTG